MRARLRALLLVLSATVCVSHAQTNNGSNDNKQQEQQEQQQRVVQVAPIQFSIKSKDTCTMVVSEAGDFTRLRISCKSPRPGHSYYCNFQGKPNLCRPYNLNPRHYFTQMMWEIRKLSHACQGHKTYRPQMCKKYPEEAQMTFLSSWPKTATAKPTKVVQETHKPAAPAQTKLVTTAKPVKPLKPQTGKGPQSRRTTPKPGKNSLNPTEQPESTASHLANEYCWKSFHGVCSYVISWFNN